MNKIVIDREEFCLDDFKGEVEIRTKKLELTIKGHVYLIERIKDEEKELIINLEDNAFLEYNSFGLVNKNSDIIINQSNNSKMIFKNSAIANNNVALKITNNILGNNNISEVIVRAISKNANNIMIDATLNVDKNTTNNEVREDLRGLEQNNGKITIIPNMLVSSSEVIANHNVTISNVDSNNLFYLTSKGLSEMNAKDLLESGFLSGIFNEKELKEQIKEIIK